MVGRLSPLREELLVTTNGDSEIKGVIVCAWNEVLNLPTPTVSDNHKMTKGRINHQRSRAWVDVLAKKLEALYQDDDKDIRVFWKDRRDPDFMISELLYDIAICQCEETKSIVKGRSLPFVTRNLLLVESELQTNNSRAIVVDLSKLVMGCSEKKLFVAGLPLGEFRKDKGCERMRDVLKMCKEPAFSRGEPLYFCFIPHPEVWTEPDVHEYEPSVWRLKGDRWVPAP